MQKTNAYLVGFLGLVVGVIVVVAMFVIGQKSEQQDRFSVSGSGTVYAKADVANINVGLKTQAKQTPAEATDENSKKMNQIVQELKKMGIEEEDIKTSNYNLNPVYNWTQEKGQEIKGYEVSQTLTLKVRELEKIGELISKTSDMGANQIGNIDFTIDDEFELKNQARKLAIEKAREKAEIIAKQTGLELGKIVNVYESEALPIERYSNATIKMEGAGGQGLESPDIQTGQNEVKIDVTLTFEVE